MKPKNAKEIVCTEINRENPGTYGDPTYFPVRDSLEFGDKEYYWQALRNIIEGIEKAGYAVSITKNGKEYNK